MYSGNQYAVLHEEKYHLIETMEGFTFSKDIRNAADKGEARLRKGTRDKVVWRSSGIKVKAEEVNWKKAELVRTESTDRGSGISEVIVTRRRGRSMSTSAANSSEPVNTYNKGNRSRSPKPGEVFNPHRLRSPSAAPTVANLIDLTSAPGTENNSGNGEANTDTDKEEPSSSGRADTITQWRAEVSHLALSED